MTSSVALWCSASFLHRPIGQVLKPSIEAAKFRRGSDAELLEFRQYLEKLAGSSRNDADLDLYVKSGKNAGYYHIFLLEQVDTVEHMNQLDSIRVLSRSRAGTSTIVMLVQSPSNPTPVAQAFMDLQNCLLALPYPPTALMVPSVDLLIPYLQNYVEEFLKPMPLVRGPQVQPSTIFAYASLQPLSHDAVLTLTDMFPSIKALEEATRTAEGVDLMHQHFDESVVRNLVDFWADEWII